MPSNITVLFLLVLFFVCLSSSGVYAFGAGNIPSFAYMEGRAFRHGDIHALQGLQVGGIDIKRVYFGNWLRDYSQAMDIATLKKVPVQTIINLCMVLGFLAHGYATAEFEVTEERLGVYLPTEHIDNPKGYGAGEDPRHYHPKLRGPVEVCATAPIELEVDPRTGMKNYIANDTGHWDTSRALVRRTLEQCIHLGRKHRSQGQKQDEYEAYRLLGQALHTLEDFSAHSNFCEIALVSMGHQEVFLHVGDQCRIQAPNGKWVAPLVTGTFGGSDFTHSLLGEAGDHLPPYPTLNKELDKAHSTSRSGGGANPGSVLRDLLFSVPGGGGSEMAREMEGIERIRAGPAQGGKRPEDMTPQEAPWDSVAVETEKIPGLGPLIEKIMDSISGDVVQPFIKPLLKTATSQLSTVAAEAINNQDQYEVFNDPRASDPTHSFLSKDHFNLILNEPAGHLARIVLIHTVTLVIKAWDDNSINVNQLAEDVLSCLFHPDFHNKSSKVQREMMEYMHTWVNGLGARKHSVIQRLSKNAVRNHENARFAANQAHQFQAQVAGYATQHIPGAAQAQAMFGGHGHQGPGREMPGGGGGHASSYYEGGGNAPPPQPSYGSPAPPAHGHGSHGPPGHGHGHGSHAPPGAPSFPGEASPYGAPPGPPPSFPGSESSGYNPSYAPPPGGPPSFPGAAPSFPGAPGGYGSPPPPQGGYGGGFPGGPPEFPGASPGFPGAAPGFPGADPYSSPPPQFPGAQNQYPPPSGPPYGQGQW
ncbi:heterokaryon incompatibility protein HET-C [Mycena olivaceomarginata]|nr:heterokaryon incompatibility protein HET-C [Mycena olivaceomarginata]